MTTRIVVGVVAIVCGAACGVMSAFLAFEMVDKVNEKLPEVEKFDHLGWYLSKRLKLSRDYKRFYPDGPLLLRMRSSIALMIASIIVAGWVIGIFAK